MAQLIEAAPPRFGDAVAFAACCGLRRGEICALRTHDIDLANGGFTLRRNYIERTVAIPPQIIPLPREHARQFAGPTYFAVDRDGGSGTPSTRHSAAPGSS